MPFLTNLLGNPDACTQYLKDIYNSVVLKDVVKRNNIRDVDLLERTITYLLANVGHSFSANSLSKYFKSENRAVSHETILNYIKACSEAFLFYKISREDLIGKKSSLSMRNTMLPIMVYVKPSTAPAIVTWIKYLKTLSVWNYFAGAIAYP